MSGAKNAGIAANSSTKEKFEIIGGNGHIPVLEWLSARCCSSSYCISYGEVDNAYYLTYRCTVCICQACELIGTIERVANVSHSVISDVYIKRDVPVVVTDATDSWPARRLFSLEFLHKVPTR